MFYHEKQPNVGKYTIHGWYGLCNPKRIAIIMINASTLPAWQRRFVSDKMARMIAMSKWQQKATQSSKVLVFRTCSVCIISGIQSQISGLQTLVLLMLGASQGDFFFRIWLESVIHWNMIVSRRASLMHPTLEQVFWLQNRCFSAWLLFDLMSPYIFCCLLSWLSSMWVCTRTTDVNSRFLLVGEGKEFSIIEETKVCNNAFSTHWGGRCFYLTLVFLPM